MFLVNAMVKLVQLEIAMVILTVHLGIALALELTVHLAVEWTPSLVAFQGIARALKLVGSLGIAQP